MRDYRFDVARVVCMTIIVVYVHLYAYIHPEVKSAYFIPAWAIITDACLGLFTFVSGFLLGKKYCFGPDGNSKVGEFYRKRSLRIIPLFVIAAIALWAIGFNGTRATFNGLVCISPFIKPRPQTLWYIPVILFCYIITPLISRRQLKWRVWSCLFVFCLLILLSKLLPSVDNRLGYNSFFFLVGIISSNSFDWKFNVRYGTAAKWFVLVLFTLLLVIGQVYANFHLKYYRWLAAGIGVFAILFICEYIANILFSSGKGDSKSIAAQMVRQVSYASMACYMFHRLFFWMGENIYNPQIEMTKWVYMGILVFPIMLYLSYLIQRGYDIFIQKFSLSKPKSSTTIAK